MKTISLLLMSLVACAPLAPAADAPASKPADTRWFEEARFGMFIHFGLYSIPAGQWKGVKSGRSWYAEWIRAQQGFEQFEQNGVYGLSREEYDTLLKQFNPAGFNADEWVRLAKEAGMKYLLITAKHHDGFALWPSKASSYNVVDATPFRRDILGDLAAACKKHGLKLGLYYSHLQDWGHLGGAVPDWGGQAKDGKKPNFTPPTQEQFGQYWNTIVIPQVGELMDRYQPAFFWFDCWQGTGFLTPARLEQLIGFIKEKSPATLINSRIGVTWNHPKGDALADFLSRADNDIPQQPLDRPWEASGTMQESWGYHQLDPNWKPVKTLVQNLVTCAANGGNYQLNVGPMGDGCFPPAAVRRLKEIGSWMAVNDEAIHGAEMIKLPPPPWGKLTGRAVDGGYRLYLHVFSWPGNGQLVLPGVTSLPRKGFVLESGFVLKTEAKDGGLVVGLPAGSPPDERATVVVLEFDSNPARK
jgi:alpha-L-fucosidase